MFVKATSEAQKTKSLFQNHPASGQAYCPAYQQAVFCFSTLIAFDLFWLCVTFRPKLMNRMYHNRWWKKVLHTS